MRSFHLGILGSAVVPGVGSSLGQPTFVSVSILTFDLVDIGARTVVRCLANIIFDTIQELC